MGCVMRTWIAIVLVALPSGLCIAQSAPGATNLDCHGTYSNYASADIRENPVSGIYIQVSNDSVKVQGAAGLDATYTVINRQDNGIGFQLDSNKAFSGFLNRFSGQLSLMERAGAVNADGSFQTRQILNAVCTKASAIF